MTFELQGSLSRGLAESRYPAHPGACRVVRSGLANCGRVFRSACSLIGWTNSFMLSHWLDQQLQPPPCRADPGGKWSLEEKTDKLTGTGCSPCSLPHPGPSAAAAVQMLVVFSLSETAVSHPPRTRTGKANTSLHFVNKDLSAGNQSLLKGQGEVCPPSRERVEMLARQRGPGAVPEDKDVFCLCVFAFCLANTANLGRVLTLHKRTDTHKGWEGPQ